MKFGVVGAGVTGLATALELSKNGHSVTIIERDQHPCPKHMMRRFSGIGAVLRRLGIRMLC